MLHGASGLQRSVPDFLSLAYFHQHLHPLMSPLRVTKRRIELQRLVVVSARVVEIILGLVGFAATDLSDSNF